MSGEAIQGLSLLEFSIVMDSSTDTLDSFGLPWNAQDSLGANERANQRWESDRSAGDIRAFRNTEFI